MFYGWLATRECMIGYQLCTFGYKTVYLYLYRFLKSIFVPMVFRGSQDTFLGDSGLTHSRKGITFLRFQNYIFCKMLFQWWLGGLRTPFKG